MSDVPLRDYIDIRFIELNKYFENRFNELEKRLCDKNDYQESHIELAKEDLERRLESMNQFRDQLEKQAATFLTREKFDSTMDRHDVEHSVINEKHLQNVSLAVYAVQHKILEDKVAEIHDWKKTIEGKNSRANIISIVAVIVSILSIGIHIYMSMLK